MKLNVCECWKLKLFRKFKIYHLEMCEYSKQIFTDLYIRVNFLNENIKQSKKENTFISSA